MKKYSLLLAVLLVVMVALTVVACGTVINVQMKLNNELSFVLNVGDEVDFTKYFSITDKDGKVIEVTAEMLDLSKVDLTKEGTFDVVCSYGEQKVSATFTVVKPEPKATVTVKADAVLKLVVGEEVDFKSFFEVKDKDGNAVTVIDEMLDLTKVDLTKVGEFDVTCTYDNVTTTASFTVVEPEYKTSVKVKAGADLILTVGDVIDFKSYFEIKDKEGNTVIVTDEMLDLTKVDLTKAGEFDVTCTYDGASATITFTVNEKTGPQALTFEGILQKYTDTNNWNFMISSDVTYDDGTNVDGYQELFGYNKDALIYIHMNELDATDTNLYTDYVTYDAEKDEYTYYADLADGTYQTLTIEGIDYGSVYYPELYLDDLASYEYTKEGDHYVAVDPQKVGDGVYGELVGCVYTKVEVYTNDTEITKLVFYSDEEDEAGVVYKCVGEFTFDEFGEVNFDLSDLTIVYGKVANDAELQEILDKYTDETTWNFGMNVELYYDNQLGYSCGVAYANEISKYVSMYEGVPMYDYLVYDATNDDYYFCLDNGDGTHTKIGSDSEYFVECLSEMYPLYMFDLSNCLFEKVDDHYEAPYPDVTGNQIYGAINGVYTGVELYTEGGYITKIVLLSDEEDDQGAYTAKVVFEMAGYNEQVIDISGLTIVDGGGSDIPDTPAENPQEFVDLINTYSDYNSWNFAVNVKTVVSINESYDDNYWYMGQTIKNTYEGEDGLTYTDYLVFDEALNDFYFLADFGAEGYQKYGSDTMEYAECVSYMYYADPNLLLYYEFEFIDNAWYAVDPVAVGTIFIGELSSESYGAFIVTVEGGKIKTIEGHLESGMKVVYEFSEYGAVSFELPDLGGGSDTPVDGMTTTFVSAGLGVGAGELEYTANVGANSLDETRGLQFTQANGTAILTSKLVVENVTGVSVVVQTNADLGMVVSVKVGGTSLTSNGEVKVTVAKTAYTELVTVTFTATAPISGNIEITLEPTQTKKSMYIKSITIATGSTSGGDVGGDDPIPDNVMENQTYNPDTFDKDNLQDKLMVADEAIGLPSVSDDLHILVIPVQFQGDTITQAQLDNLQKTFNGTSADTGWESVASYYSKTSYGKLNMTFDIQGIFQASQNAKYYENYYDAATSTDGSAIVLKEALSYYDSLIDYSKYDSNGDGCIDAVYIIYSAPVDFTNAEFYWAYCTQYYGEEMYDSTYAYYYMFAGFDFMDEDKDIYGFNLNAMTYIHETGHLLGLDDYYDYAENLGSNETMGGADMMDYNTGDHCSYSKIMLGWTDANIVTETKTITINSFEKSGDCILIPLSFNNSYFSEYLLIDLYTATGLNELEGNLAESMLYSGAPYGVRITHVSSQIDTPCNTEDYYSLTNYNNSITDIALIKTVEADGEKNFESTQGVSNISDLWGTGDVFSEVFPSYARNDGKTVNFDITIVSVSADSATITITYNA